MLENGGKYENISFFKNRKRGGSVQNLQILTSKCLRLRPNDYLSNIQLIIIINLKELTKKNMAASYRQPIFKAK